MRDYTKVFLDEDLRYRNAVIQQVALGLGFEGVGSGDLGGFQDRVVADHAQLLSEVEGDVVQLGDWYQGQRVRTLLKNNRDVVQPWIDGRAERTGILGRTRARTLMESGEDDRKESSDTLAKGVAGWSSPRRGDLSLFRLYFGLIPSAKPTSERCVVDEEGW